MPQIEGLRDKAVLQQTAFSRLTGVTSGSGLPREAIQTIRALHGTQLSALDSVRVARFRLLEPGLEGPRLGAVSPGHTGTMLRRPISKEPVDQALPRAEGRSIEDVLAQLAAEVPAEEWQKLPEDLSNNLDHYIYGTPRK